MSEKLKNCPYCGAESFEEPFSLRLVFDRINHKLDCWLNDTGECFERFPRNNYKDPDSKYTPDEERQRWNRRSSEKN